MGQVRQLHDRHQHPHQIDLKHAPIAHVVINAVEQQAITTAEIQANAQQYEQLA
ncbi:hypothetical protein D3C75_1303990 [compost metagenome]